MDMQLSDGGCKNVFLILWHGYQLRKWYLRIGTVCEGNLVRSRAIYVATDFVMLRRTVANHPWSSQSLMSVLSLEALFHMC